MDKNALREMLERQVKEKVESGYQVTLYAADVGEPDRLKKALNSSVAPPKKGDDAYEAYLEAVKNGTYQPEKEENLQDGYRRRDRKREAKSSLTVHSRSKGMDIPLGQKPRPVEKKQDSKNIRLDDFGFM